jgi:type II secretory pathway component PulF
MALYSYHALSRDGKKVTGQLDAASLQSARELVVRMGLYPIKIETSAGAGWSFSSLFARSLDVKEKIFFTKQLALLLKSGIPLLQALELLIEQSEGYLHTIVISLKDDIKEGKSLAEALEKFPKVFDSTYIQLVKAGEASGKLEVILERLTTFLERRQEISRRVRKALNAPLFQLALIVLIVAGLLTFVVPKIAESFSSEGQELPLPTRILLAMSNALRSYYVVIIALLVVFYLLFRWWKNTESGARAIDSLKLKIPLVRYFAKMGAVVQFSRTLGMLTESGVNLAEALSIVSKIVDNKILSDTLNEARENIIKQGRIAEYLKKTNLFPPVAIYLISTGEQSGQLGPMLLTVAENYEADLSELSDSLSSKVGPIMTLVMAVIVGFIVISIVLPLIQSGNIAEGL